MTYRNNFNDHNHDESSNHSTAWNGTYNHHNTDFPQYRQRRTVLSTTSPASMNGTVGTNIAKVVPPPHSNGTGLLYRNTNGNGGNITVHSTSSTTSNSSSSIVRNMKYTGSSTSSSATTGSTTGNISTGTNHCKSNHRHLWLRRLLWKYKIHTLLTMALILLCTSRSLYKSFQLLDQQQVFFSSKYGLLLHLSSVTSRQTNQQNTVFDRHKLRDAQQSLSTASAALMREYNDDYAIRYQNSYPSDSNRPTTNQNNNLRKTEIDDSVRMSNDKPKARSFLSYIIHFFIGGSGSSSSSTKESSSSIHKYYQSDDTSKIAQRTLTFRRYRDSNDTTGSLDIMKYPVRTYTKSQLQQFTIDKSNVNAAATTSNMTEYERAFQAKRLAYSTLYNTNQNQRSATLMGTDPIDDPPSMVSTGSTAFIDAPLYCLRIHGDVLNSNSPPAQFLKKPIMAIITSTQSTSNHTSVTSSLLYKHLIKGILLTVTASEQYNWNVVLYIAIDHTDTWWLQHFKELKTYIPVWLSVHMCVYPKNRPHHIPFNEIAMTAYSESYADYFVRVNDDTEFKTVKWITIGVSALQNDYDPPNIGVVGPTCSQGNTAIMTHDMVHRTHIEIFNGFYYPPSFNNWFLDDWISNVYGSATLGSEFHRSKVVTGWTIRHMMYETRYVPDYISAQWLPVEYERGRSLIQNHIYTQYPNHTITQNQMIANALPLPKQYDTNTIEEIINVLPASKRNSANILIWGLNFDSQYWHRLSPYGHVVFLEDKDMKKIYERKGIWRDYVIRIFPYLQYFPVGYTTARDNMLLNYDTYVMGQNTYNQYNWCDLQIAKFPEVLSNTTWDIIIVDAPERCIGSVETCSDEGGPSILPALYMTKVLVANQLKTQNSESPIHVYVDDFDRILEKEFTSRLFMHKHRKADNIPNRILERRVSTNANKLVQVAHFVFNNTTTEDANHRMVVPQCEAPLLRDPDFYPNNGGLGPKAAAGIMEVLPKLGNMLVWGIGPDCIFWQKSTKGRVIFLVDVNKEPLEIKSRRVKHVDYYKTLYPELEIYEVTYTSKNTAEYASQYNRQPNRWPLLSMNESKHNLPKIVTEIAWDVIIVDDPAGCCNSTLTRLQSLYTSKVLAESSILLMMTRHGRNNESAATYVIVDDYERTLEKEFSNQFYGKYPSATYRKTKTTFTARFQLKVTDITTMKIPKVLLDPPKGSDLAYSFHKYRDMKKLKTEYLTYKTLNGIEWNQVCDILKVLPLNGNLLIWSETDNIEFWSTVTSGNVVFLSMSNDGRSSGKNVYTYNVNYTIVDSDENYRYYFERPDLWYDLEMKEELQSIVLQTKWDVIFVDVPRAIGKYQSLYMTKALAMRSEAIVKAEEEAHARDLLFSSKDLPDDTVHVFIDDYENKVEKHYSPQFFGREPIKIYAKNNATLKYAHFAFGRKYNTNNTLLDMNKYLTKVVRSEGAVPKQTQMGWDQIRTILANLPTDGNLLVWGLGHDSPFWSRTTTGKVVFLEDGSFGTNLVKGKRWYDLVIEKYPHLEAYAINYTTKNTDEEFDRFMKDPELWEKELNITSTLPDSVLKTRWDVILVDAPLGFPGTGPGRYQSLYMSQLFAERNEFNNSSITHVFVDDYERKVEREFSQRLFARSPIEVIGRKRRFDVPPNEQAHFVFGAIPSIQHRYQTSGPSSSKFVPWSGPSNSVPDQFWDSFIILVEVNDGYFSFFLNWLYHYEALKISIDVLVVAEDDIVKKKLEQQIMPSRPFVHVLRTDKDFMASSLNYGTIHYKKLVSGRATHILSQLKSGQNVIYTDVDTVWRLNPLPYLSALSGRADAVLEVDTEKFDGVSPYYCTGFMAFVSNSRTIALMTAWEGALQTPQLNQPIFNRILHKRSYVSHQPLPNIEFPSGQMYFSKMNPSQRQRAVVVHNNYIQGTENKQIRFEQNNLWKLKERLSSTLPAAGASDGWFKFF